ncbi:branched-chain amino acid ABC transporter permease [Polaromonas sp.]|uniref:branched-chain amino acid ABC transporter permease n=1 Tax=Polaromonas sp. TaxID=1869339 RepID=UPI002FCC7327
MSFSTLINLVINGAVEGLIIALPALALTLVMGICKFPNASAGDTMTIGAYAALTFHAAGLPMFILAVGGATALSAALSWASYQLIFGRLTKSPMVASLLAAIGLAFVMRSVLALGVGPEPRTFNLPLVRAWNFDGIRLLPTDLAIAAVAGLAVLGVFCLLGLTDAGRKLRAVADNSDLARLSGIRSRKLMWLLWALAGALAGLGGVLIGVKGVLTPEIGWEFVLPAFAAVVLGGIGSPVGAVIGALLMGIAQELSVPLVGPSYKLVVAFTVMVVVLFVRPAGMFGTVEKVR